MVYGRNRYMYLHTEKLALKVSAKQRGFPITPNKSGPPIINGDDDWVSIDLTAQVGNMVNVRIFRDKQKETPPKRSFFGIK